MYTAYLISFEKAIVYSFNTYMISHKLTSNKQAYINNVPAPETDSGASLTNMHTGAPVLLYQLTHACEN